MRILPGGVKVPDTISDAQWASIQRRARVAEARDGGMFTDKAIRRRKITDRAASKSRQN